MQEHTNVTEIQRVSKMIDSLGRIQIPASMRVALNMGAGKEAGEESEVMMELHTDCIVIRKIVPGDACPMCGRTT